MSKRYISDIAKEIDLLADIEYYKERSEQGVNEAFILNAPTGYGKSYYITNEFYNYCKSKGYKILFLLPRSLPTKQFIEETKDKNDVITVRTYQSITAAEELDYDFIICDECHYFITDSIINTGTDICFELIYRSRAYKIFMSATPEPLLEVIFEYYHSTYEIPVPPENTVIKAIDVFDSYSPKNIRETIVDIMENIQGKAIVFCYSVELAKELYLMNQFKDNSLFICSEYNQKYSCYIDKDERDKMIKTHKFNCKYLICTSALDVGFSIEDEEVNDIICTFSPENWTNIIQSLGRKRQVNEQDRITLHIRNFTQGQINKLLESNNKRYEHLSYYRKHGELKYMKQYRKRYDKNNIMVIDYKLSDDGSVQAFLKEDKYVLGYYKYQEKILRDIQKSGDYAKYLKKHLHIADDINVCHKKKEEYIDSRLKEIAAAGIVYSSENLNELTNSLQIRSKKREILKRVSSINKRLMDLNKPYQIIMNKDEQRHTTYQFQCTEQD